MTTAYPETNAEVIEKALYCLKHGETESVENWLDLLHERLTTDNSRAAVRVCAIADIECSRDCGTGPCKRETSTVEQHEAAPADAAMLDWAVGRWDAEVKNRPLINVHRRSLDDTWRQVIRRCGGDDVSLLGPRHDDLVAMNTPYPGAPLEGTGNGADEAERTLTCRAIDGAMAFGYQNNNPPPSADHWLAPYWHVGRRQSELEMQAARPVGAAGLPSFPTMLRKMWSGTEVQQWIDDNIKPLIQERHFDWHCAPRTEVAGAVPKGSKLVPIEPTEEMITAGIAKGDSEFYGDALVRVEVRSDYQAMIDAAPAPVRYQILTEDGGWFDVPREYYERFKSDTTLTRVAPLSFVQEPCAHDESSIEKHFDDYGFYLHGFEEEDREAFFQAALALVNAPQPPSADAAAAPADERTAFDMSDAEWCDVFDRIQKTVPNVFGSYAKVRAAFAREAIRIAVSARAPRTEAAVHDLASRPEDSHEKPYFSDEANAMWGIWQAARRTTPDRDSIISAAQAVLRDALDEVRVHPCDVRNDEVRANGLGEKMYALYLALTAAPNGDEK